MNRIMLFIFCLFGVFVAAAQDLGGDWYGQVWQEGSTDTFTYQMRLTQQGESISGQAISRAGENEAEFVISGRWKNQQLQLQEISQTRPASPQWCLKFIEAKYDSDVQAITGSWLATGCRPGALRLTRTVRRYEEAIPFSYLNRWTGHLSQSDRDYGFYYEMQLNEDGTGQSTIVSEDAGGEAIHALRWEETQTGIRFYEQAVVERTDPNWKWCLKSGELQLEATDQGHELRGDWAGYLEHKNPQNGACAPGALFLTQPLLTRTVTENIAPQTDDYTNTTQRQVRVDRVIKVRSENIRIKVWDNGIVDGDILTLFLNGQQIISKYRVNKRKWSIPVEIIRGENLLILHADDLGDISPNTVAVSIDDGVEEQTIVLSSNLNESGAILIQPFEF